MSAVKEIYSMQEFKNLQESNELFFVDFYANWCGPCIAIAPIYAKIAGEFTKYSFFKCNVDDPNLQQLMYNLEVRSLPTFFTMKYGKKDKFIVGADHIGLKKMISNAISEYESENKYSPGEIIEIRSESQLHSLIAEEQLLFLFFSGRWCGPCKIIEPDYNRLAKQYSEFKFVKCERDAHLKLAQYFGIKTIPSFLIFRNGKQVESLSSPTPKILAKSIESEFEHYKNQHIEL